MKILALLLATCVTYAIAETDSTVTKATDTTYSFEVSRKIVKNNINAPKPFVLRHSFWLYDTSARVGIDNAARPIQVDTGDVVQWKIKNGKVIGVEIKR